MGLDDFKTISNPDAVENFKSKETESDLNLADASSSAVYEIYNKNGEDETCLYIGETKNLLRRISEHYDIKKTDDDTGTRCIACVHQDDEIDLTAEDFSDKTEIKYMLPEGDQDEIEGDLQTELDPRYNS